MKTTKLNLMETPKTESKVVPTVYMDEIKQLSLDEFKLLKDLNELDLGDLVLAVKDHTEISTGGYVFDINIEDDILSIILRSNGEGNAVYNIPFSYANKPLYYRKDNNLEVIKGEERTTLWFDKMEEFYSNKFEVPVNGEVVVDLTGHAICPQVINKDTFQCTLDRDENDKPLAIVKNLTNENLILEYGDILGRPFPHEIKSIYGEDVDYSYVRENFVPNYSHEIDLSNIQDIKEDDFVFGLEETSKGMRVCGGMVLHATDGGLLVDCIDAYNGTRKKELRLENGRMFKLEEEDILNPLFR